MSKNVNEVFNISRRQVLAGGVGVAAASVFGAPVTAEPKQGGFAKFGLHDGSQTDSLDPATWPGQFTGNVGGSVYNNLTEILPDGSIAGDLAESYESSDKSTRWMFKLVKGAAFHSGRLVTANDVVASIKHHTGEDSRSPIKSLLSDIEDVIADNDSTVVFKLASTMPDLPYLLSDYHLPVFPANEDGTIDLSKADGSGPFVMERWEPGRSAKMRRNPNYHKNNKPYFDEVELIPLHDMVARTNALLTGEVDFISNTDIKTLHLLERNKDVAIQKIASIRNFSFDMNTQVPPFNNPDFRLALKYAIDREEIKAKVFLDTVTVGNDNNVAKSMKYWAETTPAHIYDIEKAKFHLKKAGMEDVTIDLSVAEASFPGAVDAALLFKNQAAKAGININVIREPDDGFWSKVWRKKPFVGVDWFGRATIDWLYATSLEKGAAYNDTNFDNPRFNELLLQARVEEDEDARAAAYAEMQQIVHDDGGLIVIAFASYINGISNRIATGDVGGIYPCDNLKMTERWWMA